MIQLGLDVTREIVVDNFAGGGGASHGIEAGLGRPVDAAINHDAEAIALHRANHPHTTHYCESVFRVDPIAITRGRPVGLAWFSPDCTHHSKAKGGKPVKKEIRGLAWIVIRWARRVRPRVIMLENVEEFADWGPLIPRTDADGTPQLDERGRPLLQPCRDRKGQTFRHFVDQLERRGYRVEWRCLVACDYGAPTIRKRLFLIARRDGLPITWPKPTHGPGRAQGWRAAAECIDWSIPTRSIFERPRPLAANTLRRIARGVQRFVLDAADPFVITIDHQSSPSAEQPLDAPLSTITSKARHALVAPWFIPRHGEREGQDPRTRAVSEPLPTVTATANGASLVAAFLAKHYGGNETPGAALRAPMSTVTCRDHHALVAALLAPYYGQGSGTTGRDLRDPAPTITTKDRLQLVTATIDGAAYVLTDIGMRMLEPRELYRAQGFPDSYVIDPVVDGRPLPKYAQVRMCGNSVSPPVAEALVRANFSERQMPRRIAA